MKTQEDRLTSSAAYMAVRQDIKRGIDPGRAWAAHTLYLEGLRPFIRHLLQGRYSIINLPRKALKMYSEGLNV